MIGVTEAAATAGVLSQAGKILRGLMQGKLADEHRPIVQQALELVSDGQDRVATLLARNIDLLEENQQLRDQLKTVTDWSARLAEYKLFQIERGALVLESISATVKHYACPRCAETHKELHILQPPPHKHTGQFNCPRCDVGYHVRHAEPMPQLPAPRGWT